MEIILIAILIIIMYNRPLELKRFSDTVLGKIVGVVIVAAIALKFGRNTALIAAVIVILCSYSEKEGLEKKKEQPKKEAPKKEVPKKAAPKKETPKPTPASTKSDTYKRGGGLRGGAQKKWARASAVAKAPLISARPSRWGGLPVLPASHGNNVLAKVMSPVTRHSSLNVVDKDREMKITSLLNSQEARGQYGGESQGMVKRPN